MKRIWNKYKVIIIAVCLILGMGATFGGAMRLSDKVAMSDVVKAVAKEAEGSQDNQVYYEKWDDKALYKEYNPDQEIVKQVCKKFGLDYDTVTWKEITKEMSDYAEALQLLKTIGDCPLYKENAKKNEDGTMQESLEEYICDIYAFSKGKAVIGEYCSETGKNPNKSVVSDFTAAQLIEIGERAFAASDHRTHEVKKKKSNTLYKDFQWDKKIAMQVCETYNLDYGTVKVGEITQEMLNYEKSEWLLKYLGKSTLFEKNAQREGDKIVEWTLEAYIHDTLDCKEANSIIKAFCEKKKLDPDTAIIADLSKEDLMGMLGQIK